MSQGDERARAAPTEVNRFELYWERFLVVLPWCLLTAGATGALALPERAGADLTVAIGLTLLAAAWVLFGHTLRTPEQRYRPAPAIVYFTGLVAIGAVLMAHDLVFLVFAITPFLHAILLPPPLTFVGLAAASIALNTNTMGFPGTGGDMPFLQHLLLYSGVVAVQTLGIGGGMMLGQKLTQQWEERQVMVARLETALEENAGLHAQLLTQVREAGVKDERERMAREIHDTLAQGLTGIVTQLHAVRRTWEEPETARPHVDRALSLAKESLTEARRSVQALRPSQLAESQLPEALAELARSRGEETGVRPSLEVTGAPVSLSPAIEVALFRVAQEALTNVAKHADASRVGVTLSYLDDVVLLDVRDDGRGMPAGRPGGFGLNSMRQRIRGVGGSMEIESEADAGTAVSVSVPAVPGEEP